MKSLFPSTLIVGKSDELINQILSSLGHKKILNNPDIFLIDSDYSINQIREIKKFISIKPYNHKNKIIIISSVDNLEIPAQNALLKILEDPGEFNYLILTTQKPSSLLPTILSRCQLINNKKDSNKTTEKLIKPSGKFDNNFTKDEIPQLLENQLYLYQKELIKNPKPENAKIIHTLIKALDMINHNVDPINAMDYFMLS